MVAVAAVVVMVVVVVTSSKTKTWLLAFLDNDRKAAGHRALWSVGWPSYV